MKSLNTSIGEKYAYVKNGVIFKVANYDDGDSCAIQITTDNCPSFSATLNGNTKTYYLDNYIEVGDIYEEGSFKKTIHEGDASAETNMTLQEFYVKECNDTIGEAIIKQYTMDYNAFINNLSALGVPDFMVKQGGYTTEGIDQIDFTEDYYNESKLNEVKKLAWKAASDVANKYNYELVTTVEQLEIQAKQG
jgi:hypothetical protein